MILGSALASVCWWSCYHSSQLIVSIKSALTSPLLRIYSLFHNLKCQKFVVYTGGISYLFSVSDSHCAFSLDNCNCNDSCVCIGIVPLYQHILYLCQSLFFEDKQRTLIDCHHLYLALFHRPD
jgi:hypothetical protein